jgi:hypothetical protein
MLNINIINTIRQFCRPAVESGLMAKSDLNIAISTLRDSVSGSGAGAPVELMKTSEVAEILKVHPRTVRRYADEGLLERVYLNPNSPKSLRFRSTDVRGLIGLRQTG